MFFFGKKDLKSLTDAQVEKAWTRDAKRRKLRKTTAGIAFLAIFFGGMGLGVGAMALTGLLSMGGGGALAMAFCGALGGCIGTFGATSKIKRLNDWLEAKDIDAVHFERQARLKQEEERKTVLSPAAAEAFAASVGAGVKDDVKIMKPLTFRPPAKTRRGAGFSGAFQ